MSVSTDLFYEAAASRTPLKEKLYPFQRDLCRDVFAAWRDGSQRVMLQLATGGGKTVIAGALMEALYAKKRRILILVHRRELIRQFLKTLSEMAFSHDIGVIAPRFPQRPWARIILASVQSLVRKKELDLLPDYIFTDEAHHIRAKTYERIVERWPNARGLGLSATPERLDKKGLDLQYDTMVQGPGMGWLMEHKYLCRYKLISPSLHLDMSGIKKLAGDYSPHDLDEKFGDKVIADCVDAYLRYARGRKPIIFCWSIKQSKKVVEQLRMAGVRAVHIDGDTEGTRRDNMLEEFESGSIEAISNVDVFSEGLDCKAADTIVMARPTKSLVKYLQMIGRSLRYLPNKEALLMDLCDNVFQEGFGLPDSERVWTLKGKMTGSAPLDKGKGAPVRVCKACFTVFSVQKSVCPACGEEYRIEARYSEAKMGLSEVTHETLKSKSPTNRSVMRKVFATRGDVDALKRICAEMGYKDGWVAHMLRIIGERSRNVPQEKRHFHRR